MTNEEFRKKVLAYPCPHCQAEVGKPCVDKRGYKAALHSRRKEKLLTAIWTWERQKWMDCPHCNGKGRVKIVGGEQ